MRALLSYWGRPTSRREVPRDNEAKCWRLCAALLRKHRYPTTLYTDAGGRAWLIDELRLPIDEVRELPNPVVNADIFWAAGKVAVYAQQREPWFHIDHDVFLFDPLPESLLASGVFCQHAEKFLMINEPWANYSLSIIPELGWVPEYVPEVMTHRVQSACNVGVVGGTDLKLLTAYANDALALMRHPRNTRGWLTLFESRGPNMAMVICEQWLLAARVFHERKELVYGFSPSVWGINQAVRQLRERRYTHLGEAKQKPEIYPLIDAALAELET